MKKRDQISETARKLFNEYGTASINTNNIAKECGISPGNLYYHYKNKEEIIRKIYLEMVKSLEGYWTGEIKNFLLFFTNSLETMLKEQDKYRFFYREMFSLFMQDIELKEMHLELMEKRKNEIIVAMNKAMEKGYMRKLSDEEIEDYLDLSWFTMDIFILKSELFSGKSDRDKQEARLKRNMSRIIYPYLTDKGKMLLDELIF